MAMALSLALCGLAEARSVGVKGKGHVPSRQYRKSWVPQVAWDAVKARAALDLGTQKLRLYKTGFSIRNSPGFKRAGYLPQSAYLVHARSKVNQPGPDKKVGLYFAVKSRQGNYEVFPVGLTADKNGRPVANRHVTKVNAKKGEHNTYAFSDGLMPASKIVQMVRAKNTRVTAAYTGEVLAKTTKGSTSTYFVLGKPGHGPNEPAASAKVIIRDRPWIMYQRGGNAPQVRRDMPPPGLPYPPRPPVDPGHEGTVNTKFVQLPRAAVDPYMPRASR
jgi:hypothetical protein